MTIQITDLKTEYFANPIGIDVLRPRFFWRLEAPRPAARQIAYRIACASTPEKIGTPDIWDSGRVGSNQTTHIEYSGTELKSRQRVYWRVKIEDETGASNQSAPAFFEMGLLEPGDWQAQWIGGDLVGGVRSIPPSPFLRRAFKIERPVKSARLYTTALGVYECEINGVRVGDQILAPGWTDAKTRLRYGTFDVTELLQNGANVWGTALGDGWACGHIGWTDRQRETDRPKFFGQLEIEYEGGARETIATDGNWKFNYGPILQSDLLMGEHYDARLEFAGWSTPAFVESAWRSALTFDEGARVLCAPLGPPVRVTQEIVPVKIHQSGGAQIFDMGQNMVGRVRLKIKGERGQTIRLRFAEVLNDGPNATEGGIYIANLRAAQQTDYYTCRGGEPEIWKPRFTFHGFRYVEVNGLRGEANLKMITGEVLHSDTARIGDFECSDPLINQLQKNIDWGWRGNSLDIPTDCPQRDERLGWTGDAQVFVRTAAFNRDVTAFFSEWQRTMADEQRSDGAIPCTIPAPVGLESAAHSSAWHDGGPAWADAVLICPWEIYRTSGDTRILEEHWENFEKYFAYLENTAKDNLRCYDDFEYFQGFGDWLALDGSGQTEGGTPKELIGTAFYAHAANLLSSIARVLGKADEAQNYRAKFDSIRAAFTRRYVSSEGLMSPPYQTPYLLALEFNLVPDELRPKLAQELKRAIKARGGKLSTGFVGSPYINHVLTATGQNDLAYELLFQKQWPSWLYAVTQNATTIWERWDAWTHDKGFQTISMNSFNHYAYGAVGAWLYQVVAGIELDEGIAGYQAFRLQPQPHEKLTFARAHLDTLHGRIESAWKIEDGKFEWDFVVPPNTTARVLPPRGEAFKAVPGHHHFSATWK
jgi:alpha-L-rhamnosidase